MTDWEEKTCRLCCSLSGLYYKRETLILYGETDKASTLDEPIQILIGDIKNWLLKNDFGGRDGLL